MTADPLELDVLPPLVVVEQTQFRGARVTSRLFPEQYAKVLAARADLRRFAQPTCRLVGVDE